MIHAPGETLEDLPASAPTPPEIPAGAKALATAVALPFALFAGVARTANAVTRTQARLLGLERRDLIRLIEELPGIAITLLDAQSRRVQQLTGELNG